MNTIRVKSLPLLRRRVESGLSLRALGEKANINPATVRKIERGIVSPNPSTARAICDALGMKFEDCLKFERGNNYGKTSRKY